MLRRQRVNLGYQVDLLQECFVSTEVCSPCHEGSEVSTPIRQLSVIPLQPLASDSPVRGTNNSQVSAACAGRNHVSHLTDENGLEHSAFDSQDIRGDEGTAEEGQTLCTQDVRGTCDTCEQPLRPLGVRGIIDRYDLLYVIACCSACIKRVQ